MKLYALMPVLALAMVACVPDHPGEEDESDTSSENSESVEEQTEPEALVGITDEHNAIRAAVTPAPKTPLPSLVWDEKLAAVAQAYADKCVYGHSMGEYGENLFAQAGKLATVEEAVGAWGDEAADYDYATGTCTPGKKCGHYTQIAWRDSTRLGCGVAVCKTSSPFEGFSEWQYWVCNYDPPGNWQGEKPY